MLCLVVTLAWVGARPCAASNIGHHILGHRNATSRRLRSALGTPADALEAELRDIMKLRPRNKEERLHLQYRVARRLLPDVEDESLPSFQCDCAIWRSVLPPVFDQPKLSKAALDAELESKVPTKWLVLRSREVYGLGDFLAGLFSAFLLAAASGRRFYAQCSVLAWWWPYVDHTFNTSLVSFAPYDVSPPTWLDTREIVLQQDECPSLNEIHGQNASVVVLRAGWFPRPYNRACAYAWRNELESLWQAMGGSAQSGLPCRRGQTFTQGGASRFVPYPFDVLTTQGTLIYGCLLRMLFKPKHAVTQLIPKAPKGAFIIAVHVRTSDEAFNQDCSGYVAGKEIVDFAQEIKLATASFETGPVIYYRLEQDNPCSREALASILARDCIVSACHIAPRITAASHDVANSASQLASWFAVSNSDAFIVSPMFTMLTQDRIYSRFGWIPPDAWPVFYRVRGFVDHAILRLSSWSTMAALRSGASELRVLCTKRPPPAWGEYRERYDDLVKLAPPYVCHSNRSSTIGITHTYGNELFTHINAHFQDSTTHSTNPIFWGVGNFE